MKHAQSLAAKLRTIAPGETIVLFCDDYRVLMRNIGSIENRNPDIGKFEYKKAHIIIADELFIGVSVTKKNTEER